MKRDYAMGQLMLQTGIRVGELTGLNLSDVSLSEGKGVVRMRGQGASRDREILLNTSVRRAMIAYLGERSLSRELTAHALGHHFLHAGNQLFSLNRTDLQRTLSQEREAHEFAFHLLVPEEELRACFTQRMGLTGMADHFQVTELFMQA
jgi:site-specific recombinase XerD